MVDDGVRADTLLRPWRGQGLMLSGPLCVTGIEQFAGQRHTGAAENIFSPHGLCALDMQGKLFRIVHLTFPHTHTIVAEQVFDVRTSETGPPAKAKAVHRSMKESTD
jgi:hypothetical protein